MEFLSYSPDSKVWIYQADRFFTETEKIWIQEQLNLFTESWASHGTQLYASGEILNNFTILLAVDNSHANSSGCSIDKSVHFMKGLGKDLKIDFFNRLKVWIENGKENYLRISFKELKNYPNATYFNGTVQNLSEFNNKFQIKASEILEIIP